MFTLFSGKKRRGNFKWGTYKGYYCDSSWELAYVMYNIDNDIQFDRNTSCFGYVDREGNSRKYFPDFICDGTFIEIKGYNSENVPLKIQSVIDGGNKINVLYKKDIQPYLKYVKEKYGEEFYRLYDRNFPSWMDYE